MIDMMRMRSTDLRQMARLINAMRLFAQIVAGIGISTGPAALADVAELAASTFAFEMISVP